MARMLSSKRSASQTRSAPSYSKKIRYAVVGLGHIAQAAVLPAFANARKNSELVGLVSGDEEKLKKLGRKYKTTWNVAYESFEDLLKSGDIDAVYIALPNNLHRDYAVRAAEAGVHILCEKPLAVTSTECDEIIRAARQNRVKLMVAYRLHFEEANLKAIEIAQSGKLGEARMFGSLFSFQVKDDENIRLQANKGGGPLYDIGIYCINAARYLFRSEPEEVFAYTSNSKDPRFSEVEEMSGALLKFSNDRIASFVVSFGAADTSFYEIVGTEGSLRVENAYEYAEEITHRLAIGHKIKKKTFSKKDQFAAELLYFSHCVAHDMEPEPDGLEGLADVRIIEALHESARIHQPVRLPPLDKETRPGLDQEIDRPAHGEPEEVKARSPHAN